MEYVIIWLIGAVITMLILHAIIQNAVKTALVSHYKIVRWFEATGEWLPYTGRWKEAPSAIGSQPNEQPSRRSGSPIE
jgi:hypothetical protein